MVTKEPIIDFSEFDHNNVVADLEAVYASNPHRYEMALLDGILLIDEQRAVGFKDIEKDAFWVRGHFPEKAVMPGVLICECAAQLTAYFASQHDIRSEGVVALGGMNNCRFRSPVLPGDRLTILLKMKKARKGIMVSTEFQAYVEERLCAEGEIKGIMMPVEEKPSS